MIKILVACAFLLTISSPSIARSHQDDEIDRFVAAEMKRQRIPGLAVAVVKEGRLIKAKGYGFANLEHDAPVTPHTIFPIASLDKQITAAAIMLLVQEGKITLEDHLTRYYDKAPAAWRGITVRHLLTHTAGLKNEFVGEAHGRFFIEYTDEQILGHIANLPLDFAPGERWQYSDAGFILLQIIVEKASGMPWPNFFRERIFKPLGMAETFLLDPRDVFKNRATNYLINEEGRPSASRWRIVDFDSYNDIGSSVLDFAKWDQSLSARTLLTQKSLDSMWSPARLNGGEFVRRLEQNNSLFNSSQSYGFGWMLGEFRGHRIISHTGYTGTCIFRLPDDQLTVVVFTNLEIPAGSDPRYLAREIAAMYVPAVSWTRMKERPDPSPADTAKLMDEIKRLGAGRFETDLYTPAFSARLAERSRGLQSTAAELGPLTALDFIDEEKSAAGGRKIYCRARYEKGRLFFIISRNSDGLIDLIHIDRG